MKLKNLIFGLLCSLILFFSTQSYAVDPVILAAQLANPEQPMETGFCKPGSKRGILGTGLGCFENCPSGFTDVGLTCTEICKNGFTDIGLICTNIHSRPKLWYGRGVGEALWCAPGQEQGAALCYPYCAPGFYGVASSCWSYCPPGTDDDTGALCTRWARSYGKWYLPWTWHVYDWGWTVHKRTYVRGLGSPLSACKPGTQRQGGFCYPTCASGFTGVGVTCWENIPAGYVDDGMFVRRDNGYGKKILVKKEAGLISTCPDYPKNPYYPIVLVHGFMGFDEYSSKGLKYFGGIKKCLEAGGATVFSPAVSASHSTEERGAQLLKKVNEIVALTGKPKVHLIGHSHGAPTSRYVAKVAPELVASVTSVGGVNYGSRVADNVFKAAPDGSFQQDGLVLITNTFNYINNVLTEGLSVGIDPTKILSPGGGISSNIRPQDARAAAESLSTGGSAKFNEKYPDGLHGYGISAADPLHTVARQGDGMKFKMLFYSWTGRAPFATTSVHAPLMLFTHTTSFVPVPFEHSDGLVSVKSAHFGKFLGWYYMDHLQESDFPFSSAFPILGNISHPVTLFAEHARRLKNAEIQYGLVAGLRR